MRESTSWFVAMHAVRHPGRNLEPVPGLQGLIGSIVHEQRELPFQYIGHFQARMRVPGCASSVIDEDHHRGIVLPWKFGAMQGGKCRQCRHDIPLFPIEIIVMASTSAANASPPLYRIELEPHASGCRQAEHTLEDVNPRFIVTSLERTRSTNDARSLYEDRNPRLLVRYFDRPVERSRADDCLKHGDPMNDLFGRDRIGTFTIDGCGKPF
jgi:hypothetical protein